MGGDRRSIHSLDGGNLREKGHLEDLGADGRIILKWFLKK